MEAGGPGGPSGAEGGQPTEEEVRAALEEQMKKVRVEDLVLQSVASLINLTARRIAKEDERDLAQAAIGIEAVRALSGLLPEEAASQVRQALSELQVLYARESGGGGEPEPPEGGGTQPPPGPDQTGGPPGGQPPPGPGEPGGPPGGPPPPGDRPSKLWTPRGS